MRKKDCNICDKKEVPLNDTLLINGKVYCQSCIEINFPYKESLAKQVVKIERDPTVCQFCSTDFDEKILKQTGAYPICVDCDIALKNKTFPLWVKIFFISVLAIICFSFAWNYKYYRAYKNIQDSWSYFNDGDFANAESNMAEASNIVPEASALKILYSYFKGSRLLSEDKGGEALIEFNKCSELPPEFGLESLMNNADLSDAFDKHDYKRFLKASKQHLAIDSTSAISCAAVASAYACIYADKNDQAAKDSAYIYLAKASTIDSTSAEIKEYFDRINHRIASQKIITSEEFHKKYPKGWAKN